MYTAYFGLSENPFSLTPDPRFLFMSQRHREALAHLMYGMGNRGGFVLLTGEVGTGKTTLCRSLLEQIPEGVEVALVLNPKQTALELVASLCDELKIVHPKETGSLKVLIDLLNQHLLEIHARGRRTVLIIDEAQNLSSDVLEQVRLLTNLETTTSKLLQILLIGQPELQDMMARPELRQLGQRITARYHLSPLTLDETIAYVEHRLEVAGCRRRLFTKGALRRVQNLTGGVPRLINTICDRALLGAYAKQMERVDRKMVRLAASEVMGPRLFSRPLARPGWVMALAACAVLWAGWRFFVAPGMDGQPVVSDEKTPTGMSASGPRLVESPSARAEPHPAPGALPGPDTDPEQRPLGSAPGPILTEKLLTEAATASEDAAFALLFGEWQAAYPALPGITPCDRAARAGLRCYKDRGNWTTLRHLNRPVILELVDRDQNRHYMAAVRMEGEQVTVALGEEEVTLRQADIEPFWFGDFALLWRPPPVASPIIKEGDRGPDVLWLRAQLDRAEGIQQGEVDHTGQASPPSPRFDARLRERVMRFQQANFVKSDGIVGEQTLILLNTATADSDIPLLCAPPTRGDRDVVNP
jgi:general secretion pathway protein A